MAQLVAGAGDGLVAASLRAFFADAALEFETAGGSPPGISWSDIAVAAHMLHEIIATSTLDTGFLRDTLLSCARIVELYWGCSQYDSTDARLAARSLIVLIGGIGYWCAQQVDGSDKTVADDVRALVVEVLRLLAVIPTAASAWAPVDVLGCCLQMVCCLGPTFLSVHQAAEICWHLVAACTCRYLGAFANPGRPQLSAELEAALHLTRAAQPAPSSSSEHAAVDMKKLATCIAALLDSLLRCGAHTAAHTADTSASSLPEYSSAPWQLLLLAAISCATDGTLRDEVLFSESPVAPGVTAMDLWQRAPLPAPRSAAAAACAQRVVEALVACQCATLQPLLDNGNAHAALKAVAVLRMAITLLQPELLLPVVVHSPGGTAPPPSHSPPHTPLRPPKAANASTMATIVRERALQEASCAHASSPVALASTLPGKNSTDVPIHLPLTALMAQAIHPHAEGDDGTTVVLIDVVGVVCTFLGASPFPRLRVAAQQLWQHLADAVCNSHHTQAVASIGDVSACAAYFSEFGMSCWKPLDLSNPTTLSLPPESDARVRRVALASISSILTSWLKLYPGDEGLHRLLEQHGVRMLSVEPFHATPTAAGSVSSLGSSLPSSQFAEALAATLDSAIACMPNKAGAKLAIALSDHIARLCTARGCRSPCLSLTAPVMPLASAPVAPCPVATASLVPRKRVRGGRAFADESSEDEDLPKRTTHLPSCCTTGVAGAVFASSSSSRGRDGGKLSSSGTPHSPRLNDSIQSHTLVPESCGGSVAPTPLHRAATSRLPPTDKPFVALVEAAVSSGDGQWGEVVRHHAALASPASARGEGGPQLPVAGASSHSRAAAPTAPVPERSRATATATTAVSAGTTELPHPEQHTVGALPQAASNLDVAEPPSAAEPVSEYMAFVSRCLAEDASGNSLLEAVDKLPPAVRQLFLDALTAATSNN